MPRVGLLALIAGVLGCAPAHAPASEPAPGAAPAPSPTAEALDGLVRWRAQGIQDYTVELTVACMCRHRGTYRLTVDDGRLARAVNGSGEVADEQVAQLLPTVDGLYKQIADAMLAGTPARVALDPELSYPRDVVLGTPENDAGVTYTLRDLRRIDR